jgi:hypothetical protein
LKTKLPLFNLEKLELGFAGKPAGFFTKAATAVYRARVGGGWLVVCANSEGMSGVTFYPDPKHCWDGGSLS